MLLLLVGIIVAVLVIGVMAQGLGVLLGIGPLFVSPPGGRTPNPERARRRAEGIARDEYFKRHSKLSDYDARYQSREYKPPRG